MNKNDLHDYQKACVEHIINTHHAGVFLEMGLGKTVSTLTAIDYLMYDSLEIGSVLIVAPKRVAESVWAEEAQKWDHLRHLTFSKIIGTEQKRIVALKTKADIHIISRDNVSWLAAYYGGGLPFDMLVVDELSSFKSHKSQRFKSLRLCHFKRFVGLTGTPAPNGLIDLWPQIYLMDRGQRLGKTITEYRTNYFRPGRTNGHIVYSYAPLKDSQEQIHDKISDICMSMSAADYLKMPERVDNFIELPMPDALAKQYKNFEKEKALELYGDGLRDISVANAAALSNKLLQFANGAIYDEEGGVHAIHDLKLDALKEIVDDAQGKPVLVAWTFRHDRDRIMEYLKAYNPKELHGNKEIAEWNAGKIRVLLAHPASAGHGLNLQAGGNIVVWFGQTWSLELYQQFNARLYRQGQTNTVIINHLITKGTHDSDVIDALKAKNGVQLALMDSIKAKIAKYLKK